MKFILLLFLLTITQNLLSQNIKIAGKIVDTNGENIIGVHIVDKNSKYGAISNKFGFFELNANSFKDTLEISHIAYNTLTYIIPFNKYNSSDSIIFIDITLSTRTNILNQVEIKLNKENLVLKNKNIWIYDYELLDIDKILLIMDDTSKGEVHLINQHYRTIDKIKINNKFLKIENDCFNNIYLETNDSLYQIYIQDTIIYFYSAIFKKNFNKNLKNCEVVTDSIYVYSQYAKNNQLLTYYYINRKTKKDGLLYKIFNQERYINSQDVKKVQMLYSGVDYLSDLTPDGLKKYRKYFQWTEYYNQIASIPIYNPIIFVRDSIYIFDFYNNKLVVFNENGRYKRKCKINFHHEIKLEEICLDTYQQKVYIISSTNGLISLNIIDLNTGKISNIFKIKNHLYPQKIKIRNNFVYFLDKTYNNKKKLYKVLIKS